MILHDTKTNWQYILFMDIWDEEKEQMSEDYSDEIFALEKSDMKILNGDVAYILDDDFTLEYFEEKMRKWQKEEEDPNKERNISITGSYAG